MELQDKVVVVTGGGNGIGRAMCERFAREKPRGVMVADVDAEAASRVAADLGMAAFSGDVGQENEVKRLVESTESEFGPIDLFCSNAGIAIPGGENVPDEQWRRITDVNFMAHLYAVRAVVPGMLDRGEGYLLHTSSAAGLLTEMSSAPYSVTKHAVISLAEWIAIEYGDRGVKVSCLCPQGVRTNMLLEGEGPVTDMLLEASVTPEHVAECVISGLREEKFLILPHPEVAEYFTRKASDYDRWLRGMRRLKQSFDDVKAEES